jgi:hypothetical protein
VVLALHEKHGRHGGLPLQLSPAITAGGPGRAAVHCRIGDLLQQQRDPVGARAAYEASLKVDPTFSPAAEALKKLR